MNETLYKVEIEKINYYEKFIKNEINKRKDFILINMGTLNVKLFYLIQRLD